MRPVGKENRTMRSVLMGLVVGTFFLTAVPTQGQVAWESPLLLPPGSSPAWGIYLVDPSPGSGIGALATWRGQSPLGFRIGLAEGFRDELAVYGGIDASGSLVRASEDFPLDVDWVTGAGIGVGEATMVSFPFGLSLGRTLTGDGVVFLPYVTPRVMLDAWFGSDRPRSGARLNLGADIGMDLSFTPGWAIRFGATFGDRNALAIGLASRVR
jgi:hypothetical protein